MFVCFSRPPNRILSHVDRPLSPLDRARQTRKDMKREQQIEIKAKDTLRPISAPVYGEKQANKLQKRLAKEARSRSPSPETGAKAAGFRAGHTMESIQEPPPPAAESGEARGSQIYIPGAGYIDQFPLPVPLRRESASKQIRHQLTMAIAETTENMVSDLADADRKVKDIFHSHAEFLDQRMNNMHASRSLTRMGSHGKSMSRQPTVGAVGGSTDERRKTIVNNANANTRRASTANAALGGGKRRQTTVLVSDAGGGGAKSSGGGTSAGGGGSGDKGGVGESDDESEEARIKKLMVLKTLCPPRVSGPEECSFK